MPLQGKHGVQWQPVTSIDQIGMIAPRAEHGPEYSSCSELERWVRYGRATDQGPTTLRTPPDRAWFGKTGDIRRQRAKLGPVNTRDHLPAVANDAPSKFASIANIVGRPHATATEDETPGKPASVGTIDIEQLSKNLVRLLEQGAKAMAAYWKPRQEGRLKSRGADEVIGFV